MTTCPSCGTENPQGFRFCGACGAALGEAGAGEVRKTVTVLFCDMVGSTALGERTDPEVLRETMRRYHASCRAILERHGGTVEKFVGDAAMAVFGIPKVHEDDPLRAVRAAVEMRDAVRELGIQTRIGVNTGEVVTGRGETLVTGDAVNVAARLEQAAQAGEILIGAATRELCGAALRTDPAEPLALKGKREPVPAYRVRELVAGAEALARVATTPFVGREAELAQLEAALAAAARGIPQIATIVGSPGIGKSRLARELLARSGARVLIGRCLSYGANITYWPLAEVVREIGDLRAALADAPDADMVAARVGAAVGTEGAGASPEEIAWGFRRLFETLARQGLLIVVLDDTHWAEPILLDLIEYVAAFAREAPLALLCTARPELFERRPTWATPRQNALTLTLEPLPGEAAARIVDELGALTAERRALIVDAAEGNPLFVEQLVAMQKEHGDEALAIPLTLQALLAARIDGLEPTERAVLERGAVEGRLFHRGAVAQLLPEPERPGVGSQLLTLVRKSLVRPDETQIPGDDGFRFGHVLIRDAAYDAIPKRQRADLHERFAGWLSARLGDAAPSEIVGYHLEQAHRYQSELGLADAALGGRAAEQLRRAGEAARVRGDVAATIGFFSRAASLVAVDHPLHRQLLVGHGEALLERGDYAVSIAALEQAVAAARAAGDEHVEWRARLLIADGRTSLGPSDSVGAALTEARAAVVDATRRRDDVVAAHAWLLIARIAFYEGRLADQREALDQASRHARAAGDRELEVSVLRPWGPHILFGDVSVDEGLRRLGEIGAVVGGDPRMEGFFQHILGHLRGRTGDHAQSRALIAGWRRRTLELGQEVMYASTADCIWDVSVLAEDWAAGEAALREAIALLEARGDTSVRCTVEAFLGDACIRQGRFDEAERYARLSAEHGAPDDVLNEILWRRVLAVALAARGERDTAIVTAREAIARADGSDYFEARADARLALARALGPGDEAARTLEEAIAIYERKGNVVMRDRTRGLLAEMRG
jgi:class 3 adenylate cyclase/tetratricopeptide (TPR) repeat protein